MRIDALGEAPSELMSAQEEERLKKKRTLNSTSVKLLLITKVLLTVIGSLIT